MTDFVRTTKTPTKPGRTSPGWLDRVGRTLRRRHTIVVDGVRYRARSKHHRPAGSSRTQEERTYDVRFADGQTMRFRSSGDRVFDDLIGGQLSKLYTDAAGGIRPGSRVLDLVCGTGGGAAALARLVGPSGSVVALDRDTESIRFARRRYRQPNIAFEIGGVETLDGEPDGAFDAAFVVLGSDKTMTAAPSAVKRVTRPGGVIVAAVDDRERDLLAAFGDDPETESTSVDGRVVALARFG